MVHPTRTKRVINLSKQRGFYLGAQIKIRTGGI